MNFNEVNLLRDSLWAIGTIPEHILLRTGAMFFIREVTAVVDAVALGALGDAPVVGALEEAFLAVP